MTQRNTVVRSMHDTGLAAWFGGSLMGAVGLNGATSRAEDPTERLRLSSLGWKLWSPVAAGAIAVHGIGGAGLIWSNRGRMHQQGEGRTNAVLKGSLTVVAAGLTAYAGLLGKKVEDRSHEGAEKATEPGSSASDELASAQQQLTIVQWAIPAVTGVLVVLGAQQGEQQRASQRLRSAVHAAKPVGRGA